MAGKQARIIESNAVVSQMLRWVDEHRRYPVRDRVVVLLSFKAGLRPVEIARLQRYMVLDATGVVDTVIHLENRICKKGSGRTIPMNDQLRAAIIDLFRIVPGRKTDPLILSERAMRENADEPGTASLQPMLSGSISYFFYGLYQGLGMIGCSGYSGRRTFITKTARAVQRVGGSVRDAQFLAGHKNLETTQRYIDGDDEARQKVVQLI